MLIRSGLLLAFATVLLQITVYLQPLLPEKYHIAPVCMSITHNLIAPSSQTVNSVALKHESTEHLDFLQDYFSYNHHHTDDGYNHQCQYCTVYGDLVMPPDFGIQEVFDRIQVRLFAFVKTFKHVYFELQRLFLIPQGRAPPFSL